MFVRKKKWLHFTVSIIIIISTTVQRIFRNWISVVDRVKQWKDVQCKRFRLHPPTKLSSGSTGRSNIIYIFYLDRLHFRRRRETRKKKNKKCTPYFITRAFFSFGDVFTDCRGFKFRIKSTRLIIADKRSFLIARRIRIIQRAPGGWYS